MDNFYVYMYLRANNSEHGAAGTPYYVGKGRGNRAYSKNRKITRRPTDPSRIVFVAIGLTEQEAFQEETRLIKQHGRIDLGTGCLRNRTDGGEGQSGRLVTEEERKRKSEWMKAHLNEGNRLLAVTCHTPEVRAKAAASNRGKKRSKEYCKAQSERFKGVIPPCAGWNAGVPRTEEQKKRHSELLTGRKQMPEAVAKRATANKESSLKMFGCTGIERRRMRRRERYAELHQGKEKGHGNLGKKASEETRLKMSVSQRNRDRGMATHCKNGHPRTPENIRANGKGCVICHRQWAQRNKAVQQESQRCGLSAAYSRSLKGNHGKGNSSHRLSSTKRPCVASP
jgi:hypothetical protein